VRRFSTTSTSGRCQLSMGIGSQCVCAVEATWRSQMPCEANRAFDISVRRQTSPAAAAGCMSLRRAGRSVSGSPAGLLRKHHVPFVRSDLIETARNTSPWLGGFAPTGGRLQDEIGSRPTDLARSRLGIRWGRSHAGTPERFSFCLEEKSVASYLLDSILHTR
jgi:hypothetical protein